MSIRRAHWTVSGAAGLLLWAGCGVRRSPLGPDGDPTSAPSDGGRAGDAIPLDPTDGGNGGVGLDGGSDKALLPPSCGSFRLPGASKSPDVLVVLDKSGSMRDEGHDRWAPSVAAIEGVVGALPEVQFGLLTFPDTCESLTSPEEQLACATRRVAETAELSCQPGSVAVPVGAGNGDAIRAALAEASPLGATPTAAAIDTAASNLLALPVTPESGTRAILLVTDGAPNCVLGLGGALGVGMGPSSVQPEAVTQTVDAIARAAVLGVKTHVIGYDSQSDPYLAGTLDQMAAAGGTGASAHSPVEDQASLVAVLGSLTRQTLLCELRLAGPTDPTRISVTLDGSSVPRDDVNGWALAPDGSTLALRGAACERVTSAPATVGIVDVACTRPAEDAGTSEPPPAAAFM